MRRAWASYITKEGGALLKKATGKKVERRKPSEKKRIEIQGFDKKRKKRLLVRWQCEENHWSDLATNNQGLFAVCDDLPLLISKREKRHFYCTYAPKPIFLGFLLHPF